MHLEVIYVSGTKPGDGATIGVRDSGVDLDHHELARTKIKDYSSREYRTRSHTTSLLHMALGSRAYDLTSSHGTWVTSIVAAQPNGWRSLGVA